MRAMRAVDTSARVAAPAGPRRRCDDVDERAGGDAETGCIDLLPHMQTVWKNAITTDLPSQKPLAIDCANLEKRPEQIDGILDFAILEWRKSAFEGTLLDSNLTRDVPLSQMTVKCMSDAVWRICETAEELAGLDETRLRARAERMTQFSDRPYPLGEHVARCVEQFVGRVCAFRNCFIDAHGCGVPFPHALRVHLFARNLSFTAPAWTPPVRVRSTDGTAGVFTTRAVSAGEVLTRVRVDLIGVTGDLTARFPKMERALTFKVVPTHGRRSRTPLEKAQLTKRVQPHLVVAPDAADPLHAFIPVMLFGDPHIREDDACGHLVRDAYDYFDAHSPTDFLCQSTRLSNATLAFPAMSACYVVATAEMPADTEVLVTRGFAYWKWQEEVRRGRTTSGGRAASPSPSA